MSEVDLATSDSIMNVNLPLLSAHITAKRIIVSFLTWTIYEMVITQERQASLFSNQGWSKTKVLFLLNRYSALITMGLLTAEILVINPSTTFCKVSPWISFIGSTIMAIVVNFSLLMRVSALWCHQVPVVWFARLLFILNTLSQFILLTYNYSIAILLPNAPPFTGCMVIPTFPKLYIIFLTGIAYETCMVILTVIKSYPIAHSQGMRLSLWSLLLRDGLIYYFCIMAVQILCIVAILAPVDVSVSLPIMMSYSPIVVVGITCNRLFIQLEMLLQGALDEEDSMETVSARIFSHNDLKRARQVRGEFWYNSKKRDTQDPLSTELSTL